MSTQIDAQIQQLFDVVNAKKAEIAKIERPTWITNCNFPFKRDSANDRLNIQTVQDADVLIDALGFLVEKKKCYETATTLLGVTSDFKWGGFGFNDWVSDFKTRIAKIQISKKKAELEKLEERLNAIVSPELRRQLELAELTKSLDNI